MAVALVSDALVSTVTAGSSLTATLGAAATAGNLLVAVLNQAGLAVPVVPDGWTSLGTVSTGGGTSRRGTHMYKIAAGGEGPGHTFTLDASNQWNLWVAEFSGVENLAADIDGEQLNAASTSMLTPAVDPVSSGINMLVVFGLGQRDEAASFSAHAVNGSTTGVNARGTTNASTNASLTAGWKEEASVPASGTFQGRATSSVSVAGTGMVSLWDVATAVADPFPAGQVAPWRRRVFRR